MFHGRVPENQRAIMRAPFQAGDFPFPVKYGYASVGRVEQGPSELVGRRIFALFPHQDHYLLPLEAALPLPEELPAERAVLAANMETAVNALWDAAPLAGQRIAVIGAGTLGALTAALAARIPGVELQLVDRDPRKAAIAEALGLGFAAPEQAHDEADLVIHASGQGEGLELALSLAGFEAKVLELSWFGDRRASLPLGETFHSRRLTVASSQVGQVAPVQRPRWSRRRRLALSLQLLREPRFDCLISGESRFEDLPKVMPRLAGEDHDAMVLCHRIAYA